MCAPDMLHPFQLGSGLTMTYHDRLQSTRWCEVETPEPILPGSSSSVPGRNGFDACFELGHLNLQQGALCTVFEAPYDTQISRPSGQIASLASAYSDRTQVQTYENPKLKAAVTEVHWSLEIKQPFLSLSDFQALQINGATGLLPQVDTGWDKWHCNSGCVWRPPSLHEIILIPYDVHLHFLLLTWFFWKIWFYLNQIPNSVQPMKMEKNTRLIQVIWRLEIKQPFLSRSDSQAL